MPVYVVEVSPNLVQDWHCAACRFLTLHTGFQILSDCYADVLFFVSLPELHASHGVVVLWVVSADMHHLALRNVEFHAPFVRPVAQTVQGFLPFVSLANFIISTSSSLLITSTSRSSMYTVKKIGPRTVPCGTPESTSQLLKLGAQSGTSAAYGNALCNTTTYDAQNYR